MHCMTAFCRTPLFTQHSLRAFCCKCIFIFPKYVAMPYQLIVQDNYCSHHQNKVVCFSYPVDRIFAFLKLAHRCVLKSFSYRAAQRLVFSQKFISFIFATFNFMPMPKYFTIMLKQIAFPLKISDLHCRNDFIFP